MAKIIGNSNVHIAYSEAGQNNPIRWRIVFDSSSDNNKGELTIYSLPFRCKDYFNDVVALHHDKKTFKIYGFDNSTIKTNKTFCGVIVSGLRDKEVFKYNVNLLMEWMDQYKLTSKSFKLKFQDVEDEPKSLYIKLKFDRHLYNSFFASICTWFIRISNQYTKFDADKIKGSFFKLSEYFRDNHPIIGEGVPWDGCLSKTIWSDYTNGVKRLDHASEEQYEFLFKPGNGALMFSSNTASDMHDAGVYAWIINANCNQTEAEEIDENFSDESLEEEFE